MASKRIYITERDIPPDALSRNVLFDTNIWLSIYGITTDNSNPQTRIYSALLKALLEAKKDIYLLNTVASEYIHRSLKMREKSFNHSSVNAKIHQHPKYVSWMTDIADEVSYFVGESVRIDDDFVVSDPEEMCRYCCGKPINYNDVIISNACKKHDLLLVTDDVDFRDEQVDIVTRNRRL